MTEGPDAERDTTARDDFDRPDDSTVDWNTSTNEPTGPAPQYTPSRDDDEAGQPAARQHPWQFDPSRTTFRDRSDPYGAAPTPGPPPVPPSEPPPRDVSPARTAGQSGVVRSRSVAATELNVRVGCGAHGRASHLDVSTLKPGIKPVTVQNAKLIAKGSASPTHEPSRRVRYCLPRSVMKKWSLTSFRVRSNERIPLPG